MSGGSRFRTQTPLRNDHHGRQSFGWRQWSDSGPELRRDFFPEVDAGAFNLSFRAQRGPASNVTEQQDEQGRENRLSGRPRKRFAHDYQ